MKLLFDANISWRIAKTLREQFDDCIHVDNCGLDIPAADSDIWSYGKRNDFVIVTNDADYLNFLNIRGFPPKVILLRTGNQSNNFIEQLLLKHKESIEAFNRDE